MIHKKTCQLLYIYDYNSGKSGWIFNNFTYLKTGMNTHYK